MPRVMKKNVLFFDIRENWFSRFARDYPKAFHAWNTDDAAEWIAQKVDAEETIDLISIGNIPHESDLFVSWLILNRIPIDQIIIHAHHSDDSANLYRKLQIAGYNNIAHYQFGLTWMKGDKTCC